MRELDIAKMFDHKNVLITGGLGFIGSTVARYLAQKSSARIVLVDSLIPDYGGNLFNINGIEERMHVNIADVRDENTMNNIVKKQDVIFNLAGTSSHVDSMKDPFTDLDINCRSQLSILEACRKHNPNVKIVFSGTRGEYGRADYLPVDEKHPLQPQSPYSASKIGADAIAMSFCNAFDLPLVIARPFNTYGPRMHPKDGRVVSNFIVQALQGESITIYGDGSQSRSFCYVDDLVSVIIKFMNTDNGFTGPMNIGNPNEFTILELAELTLELTHSKSKIIFQALPADDPKQRQPDISLAKNKLGWEPKIQLREGLKKTIEYFDSILSQ